MPLPVVIERTEDGIRTESGFRWLDEATNHIMARPTPLSLVVDLLSTLSAAAMLLAVGFVAGVIWEVGL